LRSSRSEGERTLVELSQQFDVHPNQIKQWKNQLRGRGIAPSFYRLDDWMFARRLRSRGSDMIADLAAAGCVNAIVFDVIKFDVIEVHDRLHNARLQ